MNPAPCEHESEVLRAMQSGQWDEPLRTHAEICSVCQEVVLVARLMEKEAETAAAEAVLPDAGRIWWKAQLLSRQRTAAQATRPIAILERISYGLGALGAVGLVVWQWPVIAGWLAQIRAAWGLTSSLGQILQPSTIVVMGGGLLLFFLLFTLYAVWAEE